MLGKLVVDGTPADSIPLDNPDQRNLVREVSMKVQAQSAASAEQSRAATHLRHHIKA